MRDSPHVDGVGIFLQRNAREGYVSLNLAEQRDVLVAKVVIFCFTQSPFSNVD